MKLISNNRIGIGLVEIYAKRSNYTIIAAVRNPSSMPKVECENGTKIIPIKIDASVAEDAEKVINPSA